MGTIAKITAGGATHLIASTAYGTCDTAKDVAAKVATIQDSQAFTLITGVTVHIKFTYHNIAENPTLNVNNTGAKSIYRYGTTAPGTEESTSWEAGSVKSFTYDGKYWQMNDWNDNTKVTQTNTTENADYRILFSDTVDDTTRTEGARKNPNLMYNPSIGQLKTPNVYASQTVFTNLLYAQSIASAYVDDQGMAYTAPMLSVQDSTLAVTLGTNLETAIKSVKVNKASDSDKLGGASASESNVASTIVKRNSSGYVYAQYYNEANGAENPASYTSYAVFKDSNGWIRCSSLANFKSWFGKANSASTADSATKATYATLTNAGSTTGSTAKSLTVPDAASEIIVTAQVSSKLLTACIPKAVLTASNQEVWLTGGKNNATNANQGNLRCLCYLKLSKTTLTIQGLDVISENSNLLSSTTWKVFYR